MKLRMNNPGGDPIVSFATSNLLSLKQKYAAIIRASCYMKTSKSSWNGFTSQFVPFSHLPNEEKSSPTMINSWDAVLTKGTIPTNTWTGIIFDEDYCTATASPVRPPAHRSRLALSTWVVVFEVRNRPIEVPMASFVHLEETRSVFKLTFIFFREDSCLTCAINVPRCQMYPIS